MTDLATKIAALPEDVRARIERMIDAQPVEETPLTAKEAGTLYAALPADMKLRLSRNLRQMAERAENRNT